MKRFVISLTATLAVAFSCPSFAETTVSAPSDTTVTLKRGTSNVDTTLKATSDCPARAQADSEARKASANYSCLTTSKFSTKYTAPTPPPPVVPAPPVIDHSRMGPAVDDSLIPAATKLNAPGPWGSVLAKNTVDIRSPSPEAVTPSDIGSFRTACNFSHMLRDDPIVYPGQPGKSHLHVFFGNMGANASTTAVNIFNGVGSTCSGGLANQTAYWVPALIDTLNGKPEKPSAFVAYYKSGYNGLAPAVMNAPPTGLRMISGNAGNSNPAGAESTRYICYGPNGENPGWSTYITAAVAKGTCLVGAEFVMEVNFPQCWDGVNLDSPNHNSHMANPVGGKCPADHPVAIPNIAYNVHYTVTDAKAPPRWRLISDTYDVSLPAGLSGHADYMIGWDEKVKATWMKNCVQVPVDCHADNLGDGSRLSQ